MTPRPRQLDEADLFHLENRIRSEAERVRFRNPESDLSSPSVSADAREHVRNNRQWADELDQVGNLLAGLAGDWSTLGPLVRAGYLRVQAEAEELKRRGRQTEDAA